MNKILFWLKAARLHTLPMTLMSWFVIFVWTLKQGGDALLGIVAFVGLAFAHLGVNLIDDYVDYKEQAHTVIGTESDKSIKMMKGKCKYLVSGEATLEELFWMIMLFFGIAAMVGLFLMIKCGFQVAIIAALASVFCLSYPKLTYIGLGEFAVWITYGPLLFLGTYFVMTGNISIEAALLSVPTSLLTVGLLHTNALMDFDSDIKDNKKTLSLVLGSKIAASHALGLMMLFAYIAIIYGVIAGFLPYVSLITFVTLPLAVEFYMLMIQQVRQPEIIAEKKVWYGPMEHWEEIKENNADSFMLRFYISRNIMMFFSLLFVAALIIG